MHCGSFRYGMLITLELAGEGAERWSRSDSAFASCFHCLRGQDTAFTSCFHAFAAKTPPLPRVSTAFLAKTPPLPRVSTAFPAQCKRQRLSLRCGAARRTGWPPGSSSNGARSPGTPDPHANPPFPLLHCVSSLLSSLSSRISPLFSLLSCISSLLSSCRHSLLGTTNQHAS